MQKKVFVGFGFGAIQSGLFLFEAFQSGNFDRLVVAEVIPEVVDAVRRAGGVYRLNVATRHGVEIHEIKGVEIFNPTDATDRDRLIKALEEATEIATALPSVDFYTRGTPSIADLLARVMEAKLACTQPIPCIIYTAENNNHAAELLSVALNDRLRKFPREHLASVCQPLNTVIGKMSKVVTDPEEIKRDQLATATQLLHRAFLVEEFNRILISTVTLPGFRRGIDVFQEKDDLLPFEEAKLYGHNATHALLGYLANRKSCRYMSEAASDSELMTLARTAFLNESGAALIARRGGTDPLFTVEGYRSYVDDLMDRMVNPHLRDAVERVIRDPRRKLGWDDRLIGTMRLALDAGIQPVLFARGAAAALDLLKSEGSDLDKDALMDVLWESDVDHPPKRKSAIKKLILSADS
jgi:mannitol-1-phosphate 5-dehydrogenase